MEFTLLGAAAIAGGVAYGMLWWEAKRGNADRCAGNLWETALMSAVAGIFIGRIMAMLIDGVNPLAHPMDVMLVRSGVSTVGASLGTAAVFLWLARKEPIAMADGISAAALAGLAGWHAGCLVRGTCLGTASDLPWALAQESSTVARHPVGIYAALLLAMAAIAIAWWKAYRRPPAGTPASLAIVAAAAVRLATEPFQPSLSGGPVWFY
ncbi:MAG: prolipoprotein diacylglyceryl transferase family protein, partial [Actinomycetota bacterium]|nr:prolipoprotein diacylglyceryl transferase family protein [Actinomycetota bacterium]